MQKIVLDNKEHQCPLALTLRLIGDKYRSLIIFHLKDGTKRSGELQKSIKGISNRMFTFTVRALENDGLISRKIYAEVPPKVEYSLTNTGKSLLPIILELEKWGRDFVSQNHSYAPDE